MNTTILIVCALFAFMSIVKTQSLCEKYIRASSDEDKLALDLINNMHDLKSETSQ
jgi:hypothetical protein